MKSIIFWQTANSKQQTANSKQQTANSKQQTANYTPFSVNQNGAYSVIMAGLSFIILGIMALAVDGSGLFLDKARFSQGLEQGALALVAENNANRQNKAHPDVLRQQISHTGTDAEKLSAKQEMRNQELLRDIARHYYYPSGYMGDMDSIEDNYYYKCKANTNQSVTCQVLGNFYRPSWLYMPSQDNSVQLSFAKNVQLFSDEMYAQKGRDNGQSGVNEDEEISAVDVMFVWDLSGSMRHPLVGRRGQAKIDILVAETKKLAKMIFENNPENRIGYVGFSWGARQSNTAKNCVMPYDIDYTFMAREIRAQNPAGGNYTLDRYIELVSNRNDLHYGRLVPPYVHIDRTFRIIDTFDGNPIDTYREAHFCMREDSNWVPTTDLWFSKRNESEFYSALDRVKRIRNDGHYSLGTLSTSGFLVGANLILNDRGFHGHQSQKNVKRRKILITITDGYDSHYYADLEVISEVYNAWLKGTGNMERVVGRLLAAGLCDRVRKRWKKVQDPNVPEAVIAFIAIGFDAQNVSSWKRCVDDGYYVANTPLDLSKALNEIISKAMDIEDISNMRQEEVGHSLPRKPQGWN